MLIASALYNIVGCGIKRHTALLRRIDHAFIYVMIAVRLRRTFPLASLSSGIAHRLRFAVHTSQGCYTPCLLQLKAGAISAYISNELALAAIWVIAVAGAAAKYFLARCVSFRVPRTSCLHTSACVEPC
jgi:predicted membrane channel-forming protein YqfA (hemolysin III family)